MLYILCAVLVATSSANLLERPAFPAGPALWTAHPPEFRALVSAPDAGVWRIALEPDTAVQWRSLVQRQEASPGERYALTAEVRTEAVYTGGMFTIALHFYDDAGARIGHADAFAFAGLDDWTPAVCRAEAPPGTAAMTAGIHTHGIGVFEVRDFVLERLPDAPPLPAPGEAIILSVTTAVTVPSLVGFGAEDDGWFYNAHNTRQGVTEADGVVREARIAWMQPDWVRSFFWLNDWNPSHDLVSFDWDTDNMRSQYRTLDLYQRLGARVTVCHTEWGWREPWADPEAYATAIGALMEHLIVTRGYTCITDWTLTNEPNLFFIRQGGDWDTFVRLHRLVAEEFERRGLIIGIVGSDDGENLLWFRKVVQDDALSGMTDLYASHAYFRPEALPFLRAFFADRVALLRERGIPKPVVMAEYGFFDARSVPPFTNPFMEEYDYALLNHRAIIEGVNAGVAGFNIWCMNEVYYPGAGEPMNFGLWDFVDRGARVRPVFHSMAAFSRHTTAGMSAIRCDSTHPETAHATRIGDTLFWFHAGDDRRVIRVEGAALGPVRAYTQSTLSGDRECGLLLEVRDGAFTAPPRSFGFAQLR